MRPPFTKPGTAVAGGRTYRLDDPAQYKAWLQAEADAEKAEWARSRAATKAPRPSPAERHTGQEGPPPAGRTAYELLFGVGAGRLRASCPTLPAQVDPEAARALDESRDRVNALLWGPGARRMGGVSIQLAADAADESPVEAALRRLREAQDASDEAAVLAATENLVRVYNEAMNQPRFDDAE